MSNNKRIQCAVVALLFVAVSLFAGCKKETQPDSIKLNVAYFPNITHAQALVMKSQGTLEKINENCAVTWTAFNAGPAEIEALFAGEIDIGYIGPVPAINGYVNSNGDLKIIAGATNGGSVLVAGEGSSIASVADLVNKKVAVPQFGNTQHLSLLDLLSSNNLSPTSAGGTVNVIQASNADIPNLMEQKELDAALVPEPWGSILELEHGCKLVLDYDQISATDIPSTAVVIVRQDYLDEHRDIVEAFIKAHKEATDYINGNTEQAKKIIKAEIETATGSSFSDAVMDSAFKRLVVTYDIPENSISTFAELNLQEKFNEKAPDGQLIANEFIG